MVVFISSCQNNRESAFTITSMDTADMRSVDTSFTNLYTYNKVVLKWLRSDRDSSKTAAHEQALLKLSKLRCWNLPDWMVNHIQKSWIKYMLFLSQFYCQLKMAPINSNRVKQISLRSHFRLCCLYNSCTGVWFKLVLNFNFISEPSSEIWKTRFILIWHCKRQRKIRCLERDLNSHLRVSRPPFYQLSYRANWDW